MKKEELKSWINEKNINRFVFDSLNMSREFACLSGIITIDMLESFVQDIVSIVRTTDPGCFNYIRDWINKNKDKFHGFMGATTDDDRIVRFLFRRRNGWNWHKESAEAQLSQALQAQGFRWWGINYAIDSALRNFRRHIRETYSRSFNTETLYTISRACGLKILHGNWQTQGWRRFKPNRNQPIVLMYLEHINGIGPVFMYNNEMYAADLSAVQSILPVVR